MSHLLVRAAFLETEEGSGWRGMAASFCCDEMNEAWEDKVVGFGDREGMTTDPSVNIYQCTVWPEGTIWTEYQIRFCPFCGTEIELQTAE
jgi:hypothetical protein